MDMKNENHARCDGSMGENQCEQGERHTKHDWSDASGGDDRNREQMTNDERDDANEIEKQVIGEDPDLEKSGRILNRVIAWNRDGITIEADQRHGREILKGLVLERANHSATQCAMERKDEGKGEAPAKTGTDPD